MNIPQPSWPWQPRRNPLPPPIRAVLSLLGWGIAVLMAYFVATYILDFLV